MTDILTYVCVRVNVVCNLNCIHCRAGSNPFLKGEIDKTLLINFVDSLTALGLNHVNITGGEPTMYSKISELISELLDKNLWVTITTNGLNDFTKMIQKLKNINLNKLRIRISIDGDKPLHEYIRGKNTYNRTVKNLKNACDSDLWVAINTVIYNQTIAAIPNLFNDIKDTWIDEWAIITPVQSKSDAKNPFDSSNDASEHIFNIKKAEDLIKSLGFSGKIHCIDFYSHPNTYLFIDEKGWAYFPGFVSSDDIVIGHIANINLNELNSLISGSVNSNSKSFFKW